MTTNHAATDTATPESSETREVCRYCDAWVDTPQATPFPWDAEVWHEEARCVEPDEPIRP